MKEHEIQSALFEWAEWQAKRTPEVALLHHIPNGGRRDPAEAAHLKKLGVKAGVPDLHLPVARGRWHSLYIELKRPGGKPSASQNWWLSRLEDEGNKVAVCYSVEQTIKTITEYLNEVE